MTETITKETNSKHFEVDATGKSMGRLASEVAILLMGKNSPDFERHILSGNSVLVINASKLIIPSKKMKDKVYVRYSGYPGGLKKETLADVMESKGIEEVLRRAVYGMLPSNKLRKDMMQSLEIRE